jgi:hypothetical protein
MEEITLQNWKIGVLSTDYDLHPVRAKVINLLSELGFEPIAFELPTMRVEPGVHSHQACVLAVEASDIVILIIDRRYGGLYLGKGPYSITEEEFLRAYRLRKVIIPCVSKKAFDDRWVSHCAIQKLMQDEGIDTSEARKKIQPQYVEKWKVLDFIERIRKLDRDQYLVIYDNEADLATKIKGRLKGLSRFVCSQIVEKQVRWIDSLRSVSGMFEAIGVLGDVGFFIDPPFQLLSGGTRRKKVVSLLHILQGRDASVLVTGDPGIGKSVLLAQAFKKHARRAIRNREYRLPFFVSLRGIGAWYHFNAHEYICECFRNFLKRKPFPTFTLQDIHPVFYIDGFDESTDKPSLSELQRLASKDMMSSPFILCTRSGFAKETIDASLDFGSKIEFHVRLLEWSRSECLSFVQQYCGIVNDPRVQAGLERFLKEASDDHPVLRSPLLLALVVWLATVDDTILLQDLDLNTIYSWFIQKWATREIQRYGKPIVMEIKEPVRFLTKCWEMAAWTIYERRHLGEALKSSDLVESLMHLVEGSEKFVKYPFFESLLTFASQRGAVTGMLHEQFLEYLLARAFVEGCITKSPPFPYYLNYQIDFQVNRFIKAVWATKSRSELLKTLEHLKEVFLSNLFGETPENVNARVNSIYYISRVPLESNAREILEEALRQDCDLYTKNGILFALVRLGDQAVENQLYSSLVGSEEADAINRGLHLVYFRDWNPRNESPPYKDDGTRDWRRTLAGMMSHIENCEKRFINSRRLDIYIVRSFIRSRGQMGPFTEERLHRIRASVTNLGSQRISNSEYFKGISCELSLLESLVQQLSRDAKMS